MRDRLQKGLLAFALAVSLCVAPYAQTAYAWAQLAIPAGKALAAVMAVLGVSVVINNDDDASALWSDFELYTDDLDALAAGVSQLQDTAIANGNLVNATKSQVSQQEVDAIKDVFAAAGQAGTFALDQLSIMASDGVLGILPFLLSLFVADQVSSSVAPEITYDKILTFGDFPYPIKVVDGLNSGDTPVLPGTNVVNSDGRLHCSGVYMTLKGAEGYWGMTNTFRQNFNDGELVYPSYWFAPGSTLVNQFDLNGTKFGQMFPQYANGFTLADVAGFVFIPLYALDGSSSVHDYDFMGICINGEVVCKLKSDGTLIGNISDWTDNPDVNLGHDYWDDAKDNADILNPATGAAVIGADAVIDGDYVRNRGSMAIPSDYADINSWADALARAHAGIAQGALDGTISTTTTGTAVNVGTGELVTDTVGELVKPDAGTSVSPNKNFDWGKFLDPSLYLVFPFCLPWDLVDLVKTLSADPQAPVIDWPMPTLTGGQQTLHIDLSPWSPVATVLRIGELVAAAIGLIWITKTMIRN